MDAILNKTDLKSIKEALYRLNEIDRLIELLDKLQLPTQELQEKKAFYQRILTTLRQEQFPDQP